MPSAFDAIMMQTATPALLRVFGIPAVHTTLAGDESNVTILFAEQSVAIGEYGERLEQQPTIQISTASGAGVGDTFTVAGDVTEDEPTPDDVVWKAASLISDDRYFRTFAVRVAP
jgi:hypothetical protein